LISIFKLVIVFFNEIVQKRVEYLKISKNKKNFFNKT